MGVLLSIINVNYNSGDLLARTFSSLTDILSTGNCELIVVDGGSTDTSRLLIQDHTHLISKCLVENDNGIYDAMNKGISLAEGEWIWFLNSGDKANISAVQLINLFIAAQRSQCNLCFSDLATNHSKKIIRQQLNQWVLATRMLNHQNIIYHRSLFPPFYDTSFRYCADYHHLLKIYPQIKSLKSPNIISEYDMMGVSSRGTKETKKSIWKERIRSQLESNLSPIKIAGFVAISCIIYTIKWFAPRLLSRSSRSI